MGSTIFSGNYVKALKSKFNLNDSAYVLADGTDPRLSATTAPIGSIHMNTTTGVICKKLDAGSTTNWSEVGSGLGGVNYIKAYDGTSKGSWVTYKNTTPNATPEISPGGTPTVSYDISSSTDMRGSNNFLFTHNAANEQGNGFRYPFTIDPSDKNKVLQISLEYLIASGVYADDDLQFWISDGTALIQPAPFKLKNSGIIEKFAMEFQATSSTTYYLICHCSSVTAVAYTIRFDNWNLGPQAKLYGSPVTDWVSYTPTITGLGTVSSLSAKYRRLGDSIEVMFGFVSGTNSAAAVTMTLPSGMSPDTTKTAVNSIIGPVTASATPWSSSVMSPAGAQTVVYIVSQQANTYYNGTVGTAWANSTTFGGSFIVPIVGWSSSVIMSSDAATNVISTSVYKNGSQAFSAETKITGWTVESDRNGMWDSTNNRFNILVPGDYEYKININSGPSTTATQVCTYKINGSASYFLGSDSSNSANARFGGTATLPNLKSGYYVEIYHYTTAAVTVSPGVGTTKATLTKISGPSQIASSESVNVSYRNDTGHTLTAAAILKFDTKVVDKFGAYNPATGIFTAPISGEYEISYQLFSTTATTQWQTAIRKNSIAIIRSNPSAVFGGGSTPVFNQSLNFQTPFIINLLAGETIDIYNTTAIGTGSIYGNLSDNWLSIKRIGNY